MVLTVDTIYNEDCLIGMDRLPDKSVDMVLCDLPYGVLNKGNDSAKWDNIIPMDRLWSQYRRICKDDCPIILFGQGMFTASLMMSNPSMWRYNLIWEKDRPTGFLNANKMPLRSHEDVIVFYKDLPVYHPQMIPCKPSERCHPIGNGEHTNRNQQYGDFNRLHQPIIRDEKFPKSIISIPQEHKCDGKSHPTQKPVALLEWLIRSYSDEGDVVLDNCMGSGSTAVACVNTGRHYIGFETDPEYYRLAKERIYNAGGEVTEDDGTVKRRRNLLDFF
ncbi:MAG: site-specific DNA-methyltransferase [Clostridiales bacterium]|nr:site-specific DNA-methyltransferase [Clostridiales bacterium]